MDLPASLIWSEPMLNHWSSGLRDIAGLAHDLGYEFTFDSVPILSPAAD